MILKNCNYFIVMIWNGNWRSLAVIWSLPSWLSFNILRVITCPQLLLIEKQPGKHWSLIVLFGRIYLFWRSPSFDAWNHWLYPKMKESSGNVMDGRVKLGCSMMFCIVEAPLEDVAVNSSNMFSDLFNSFKCLASIDSRFFHKIFVTTRILYFK